VRNGQTGKVSGRSPGQSGTSPTGRGRKDRIARCRNDDLLVGTEDTIASCVRPGKVWFWTDEWELRSSCKKVRALRDGDPDSCAFGGVSMHEYC
jgi:hypothetical protein